MTRRACLSIGVSTVLAPVAGQTLSFDNLDGAVVAAKAIGDWARSSGFGDANVQVLDDAWLDGQPNPVTRQRVQAAVDALFPPGAQRVDHLVLAFCGHGITDANIGGISWLFSDSLQGKYRVKADSFYGELRLLPVNRITVISDSCREPPATIELLRLDGVRGIVLQGPESRIQLDRLAACQDGAQGFMVKAAGEVAPGKCVFSGVILDALWGQEATAIENGKITTSSLAACVRDRTAERAEEYRLRLEPEVWVDPKAVVVYDAAHPPLQPHTLQAWPPPPEPGVMISVPDGSPVSAHELVVRRTEAFDLVQADFSNDRAQAAQATTKALLSAKILGDANLVVLGRSHTIWSHGIVKPLSEDKLQTTFRLITTWPGDPVLVELEGKRVAPVVPYEGRFTAIIKNEAGDVLQAYGIERPVRAYFAALRLLEQFAAGTLSLNSIDHIATRLRRGKRTDPTLGAICAHLYRAAADYDSIRRIAFYYAWHNLPVPFDVALLGKMRVTMDDDGRMVLHVPPVADRRADSPSLPPNATRATHAVQARVGGRCPWLGVGWDYVTDADPESLPLVVHLAEHAPDVPRTGFTQLSSETALQLAHAWGLQQWDGNA